MNTLLYSDADVTAPGQITLRDERVQLTAVQCCDRRVVIDDAAPGKIDEHAAVIHQGKPVCVDNLASSVNQGNVYRDKVGVLK